MVEATDVQVAAAFGTFLAALIAVLSLVFSQRELKRQLAAQIEIKFMEDYVNIQKTATNAITEQSPVLGFQYYRETFDMHWTAHNLWKRKQISNDVMKAWLDIRRRNWEKDERLVFTRAKKFSLSEYPNEKYPISYREAWKKLVDMDYFPPDDDFLRIMKRVHDNKEDLDKIMGDYRK